MKNSIKIISIALTFTFFYSCSNSDKTDEESTEKVIENQIVTEEEVKEVEQPLSVRDKFTNVLSPIPLPFNVTQEQPESLSNTLLISNEIFDLLQLQQIRDFDKTLDQTILGKVDCEDNLTGILISQIASNESSIWYILYNKELKISDYTRAYYDNSEGGYNTISEITKWQVLTLTTSIDIDGNEIESKSIALIDMGSFVNPGMMEDEEFEVEDPIEFAIPTTEELTAGSGILPLKSSTIFRKKINSNKNAILFLEEENTDAIGGPPAITYKVVNSQSGKVTQVIPISYNPEIGEGKVLFTSDTEEQQMEFNNVTAISAEKTLEEYEFENVTKYTNLHRAFVEKKGEEWVFSISKIGEDQVKYEVHKIPSANYQNIEIIEVIEPLFDPFVIITFKIPGSVEFNGTVNSVYVVGKSELSVLHKKIGFSYYKRINTENEINQEVAIKCIDNLNSALSLNGANAEAAYYLASVYALQGNINDCLQVLNHLRYINNPDSEGYLEMVKEDKLFDEFKKNNMFSEFIKSIN